MSQTMTEQNRNADRQADILRARFKPMIPAYYYNTVHTKSDHRNKKKLQTFFTK